VVCELRCRIGGEWISKTDVGSPSEQPDVGDRMKAAFSDALKRAAVKFGIGRYLYRQPAQWADWDPAKKRFARPPYPPAGATATARAARKPTTPATPAPEANGTPAADPNSVITEEELRHAAQLLVRKGKTVRAGLKSVGSTALELPGLTRPQYQLLLEKLAKLPDAKAEK
jgi:hypothetical protein